MKLFKIMSLLRLLLLIALLSFGGTATIQAQPTNSGIVQRDEEKDDDEDEDEDEEEDDDDN